MKRFALLLLTCLSVHSLIQAEDTAARLMRLHTGNTTYVGAFTEKKVMPKLKKETKKAGTLYFQYPNALSMRYTEPEGDYSIIQADGKFLTQRNGKKANLPVNEGRASQFLTLRNTLLLSMRGDVAGVAQENDATYTCKEEGSHITCKVEKKASVKVGVVSLDLVYDSKTGGLQLLRLNEANGNYTEYAVPAGKNNVAISADVWQL